MLVTLVLVTAVVSGQQRAQFETLLWDSDALLRTRAAIANDKPGLRDAVVSLRQEASAALLLPPQAVTF